MSKKRILIVDDEEAILTVLKNSLKKVGQDYQITTVSNGFDALDELLKHAYDLVVTDFNMAEMDGLELMEAIRYAQPDAKLIMITAYGNDMVEEETQRMKAFRYLTKPLEINAFRQIVQQALGDTRSPQPGAAVWSDAVYQSIGNLLKQLRSDVSAHCIFLTDASGHMVCKTGYSDEHPIEKMTSVLGGGIATLVEAGRVIDGHPHAIHMAYREGKQEDLYALNVGQSHLLILIVKRGPYSSRLGSVWYHARLAALDLQEILLNAHKTPSASEDSSHRLDKGIDQAFNVELDKLFSGDGL